MSPFKSSLSNKGFTLLESMIVLTVMGLILAGLASAFQVYRAEQTETEMDKTYDSVRASLNKFILEREGTNLRGRYPCPAPLNVGPTNLQFGLEQRDAATGACVVGAGLFETAGANGIYIGAIPTKTLGISSSAMLDSHGYKMTYAISKNHVVDNALTLAPQGTVQIEDEFGTTSQAPFALVSHGRDGEGAYSIEGGIVLPCRLDGSGNSITADSENCDHTVASARDAVFKESRSKLGTESTFYDDRLAFSLVDPDDDEWWAPFNDSPDDLQNKNPGTLCIGPDCDPVVSRDFRTANTVGGNVVDQDRIQVAGGNIRIVEGDLILDDLDNSDDNDPSVGGGDILARHGNIQALGDITSFDGDLRVQDIDPTNDGAAATPRKGNITAEHNITIEDGDLTVSDADSSDADDFGKITAERDIQILDGDLIVSDADSTDGRSFGNIVAETSMMVITPPGNTGGQYNVDIQDQAAQGAVRISGTGDSSTYSGLYLENTAGSHAWTFALKKGLEEGDLWLQNGPGGVVPLKIDGGTGNANILTNLGINIAEPEARLHVGGHTLIEGDIIFDFTGRQIADRSGGICTNGSSSPCLHTGSHGGNAWRFSRTNSHGRNSPLFGAFPPGQHETNGACPAGHVGPGTWCDALFKVSEGYTYVKNQLGINTTDPQAEIDVVGDIKASNFTTAAAFYYNGNGVVGSSDPAGGGSSGGGDGSAVNVSCPDGQAIKSINGNSRTCVTVGTGTGGVSTAECAPGEYLEKIVDGIPTCKKLADAIGINRSACRWEGGSEDFVHKHTTIWDTGYCTDSEVMTGFRTRETPAGWERHQIQCCQLAVNGEPAGGSSSGGSSSGGDSSTVAGIVACNSFGMLYAPTDPIADANGCIMPLQTGMNLTRVDTSRCLRNDSVNSIDARCPSGTIVIGCAGGPGDLDEDDEGWYIIPDMSAQKCHMKVKKPRCSSSNNVSYQRVYAICMGVPSSSSSSSGSSSGSSSSGSSSSGSSSSGSGSSGCFLADTMITMADGSQKAIQDVSEGDMVLAFDKTKPYSDLEVRKVAATKTFDSTEYLIINGNLKVTKDHKFPVPDGRMMKAGDLKLGDLMINAKGQAIKVRFKEVVKSEQKVYNMEVEGLHSYVANGYRSGNMLLTTESVEKYIKENEHIIKVFDLDTEAIKD